LREDDYKNDDTILTGWLANGRVGFAWDAAADKKRGLPYPYVMTVEVDAATLADPQESLIWSPKYAYQYPAIAPNARGDLGGIVLRGGGKAFESCTAIVRNRAAPRRWEAYTLVASNHNFGAPYTGDYLGAATTGPASNAWAASCLTLNGGANVRKNLRIHWLEFGRTRDAPR
jgi:hypothetical protein